ncbi:MAG: hypothetical protein MJZ83_04720 [Bacteroidaceae bacterium]|nr:hypothetical protein [Bacteroidaceae bacterium]
MEKENFLKGPPEVEVLQLLKLLGIKNAGNEIGEEDLTSNLEELIQLVESATERAERYLASLASLKAKKAEEYCRKRGLYYKCKKSSIMTEEFCEECRFYDEEGYCRHFQDWLENIDECEDDAPNPEYDEEETLDWMHGGNERDDE